MNLRISYHTYCFRGTKFLAFFFCKLLPLFGGACDSKKEVRWQICKVYLSVFLWH